MNTSRPKPCKVAIACGGTGGHFFPGLAVGQALVERGSEVLLIASEKAVDRENAKNLKGTRVEFMPAVALVRGRFLSFAWGMVRALARCFGWFVRWRPDVVLVMGGFTSVAPAIIGRCLGARVYLHESNSIPGRANRMIARWCHGVFVGFPSTAAHFPKNAVVVAGTPVREGFQEDLDSQHVDSFGLDEQRPILLVMGGSQGAQAINQIMLSVVPQLSTRHPKLQYIHLTGRNDIGALESMYQSQGCRYFVTEHCADTSVVVRLASAVLSRAGASSLAEYAVVGLPSLLIPYPAAVDEHQKWNAKILAEDGAVQWLDEKELQPETVTRALEGILFDPAVRGSMQRALANWNPQSAARRIASDLLGEFAPSVSGHWPLEQKRRSESSNEGDVSARLEARSTGAC